MSHLGGTCPLSTRQIVDEYFIENRTRVLELAAFLDRLDHSSDARGLWEDFRMEALHQALQILADPGSSRVRRIQMLFSDPTAEPREKLDRKSASGAYDHSREVR